MTSCIPRCIPKLTFSPETKKTLGKFYDILRFQMKKEISPHSISHQHIVIQNASKVPLPPTNTLSPTMLSYIQKGKYVDEYAFSLDNKQIKITMVSFSNLGQPKKQQQHNLQKIIHWLSFIHGFLVHLPENCSSSLHILIYLSPAKKLVPEEAMDIISEAHVNSGFTTACRHANEIVIYRKEEWFKVLMHETLHHWGFDFSDGVSLHSCHQSILKLFPVNSNVTLFEAYTECWAEIFHTVFYVFFKGNVHSKAQFIQGFQSALHIEIEFSGLQMVKLLNHMGIRYSDFWENPDLCRKRYREKTHVLAYFVLKNVCLFHISEFVDWCVQRHTPSFLSFKKTVQHTETFVKWIEERYRSPTMLRYVECSYKTLALDKKNQKTKKIRKCKKYSLKSNRMTFFDF